jgi:serine/threonine protein kinase
MCGTPLTMAPEVLGRQSYSIKCDTWSFGVISYYLLFSRYPFIGRSPDELLNNIKSQNGPKFPNSTEISEDAKKFL